jgi:hypothetical protein
MTSSNQLQLEARIRHRARQIWQEEGCPDGRDDEIQAMAREQIAILDNPSPTTEPNAQRDDKPRDPITKEPIEPLVAATDAGEDQTASTPPDPAATSTNAPRV